MIRLLGFSALLPFCFAAHSSAAPLCSEQREEFPFRSVEATANAVDNWRGAKGSISAESERLLGDAEKKAPEAAKPTTLCSDGCALPLQPQIVFRTLPKKFLAKYSDSALCLELEAKTKKVPFVYGDRTFDSIKQFNEWFGEFSQGKGKEGEDLYQKCGGECSPQYRSVISRTSDNKVRHLAEVLCGPARDKWDNMYILSASFLWQCEDKQH